MTGMKEFRMFGNLRDFYFLQDHTTSKWGKTRLRTKNNMMGRLQLLLRPSPVPGMPAEMPASPTETSAKTGKHGMLPWPRQLPKQSQGRWQRLMHTTRLFSMREAQPPFKTNLKEANQVPKSTGRRKSYQGCNCFGHEQSMSQRQSHKFEE